MMQKYKQNDLSMMLFLFFHINLIHCECEAHFYKNMYLFYLCSLALQPSAGYGLLVPRGFLITHNDAPQSVGLL
jgi:hypothetical protein